MSEINKNTQKLKGICIKMTTTRRASGISGLIFIIISSLNKKELLMLDNELKSSRGIFVMKVEGLTTTGATNPLDTGYSYVIFI